MKQSIKEIVKVKLLEYYEDKFNKYLPMIERKYNIEIVKPLGESSGIAYLTSDSKVVKITSSEVETKLSLILKKEPNKYFPTIHVVDLFLSDWTLIIKDFVPELPNNIKEQFIRLEKLIYEWYDDNLEGSSESLDFYLNDLATQTKERVGFLDYLQEEESDLVAIYTDLINISKFGIKKLNALILDIHIDNLGYNGKHLVLYDY